MTLGIEQAMTRHQVQLQRLAGGNYRKIVPTLSQMSKDLRDMIFLNLEVDSRKSLKIVNEKTQKIINDAVKEMTEILGPEFQQLAVYESEFVKNIYAPAVTIELLGLTNKQLEIALTGSKMVLFDANGGAQSLTIKQAFKQFDSRAYEDVTKKIIGGIASGQTSKQISTDVYRMTNNRTRTQAEALVRTSTNHVASQARETFYKKNDEVIKGERYTATLDNRTTIWCIGFDGKLYPVGEGPQTPYHWNCRSIRIAEVYKKYKIPGLGETRSSVDGPVSAKTTYGDFLKKQDNEFQNEVLGKKRAEMFRKGQVEIGQFTDFGRVLSVKELEAKFL